MTEKNEAPSVLENLTEEEAYLACILMDRSGIDQAEFLWTDPRNEDNCFRAYPYQWPWWRCEDPMQVDQCARALDLDTPIPTPHGWTTMGAIRPGDTVYGDDGLPVRVLEVSQVFSGRRCYELGFDDGTSVVASGDHLWMTWTKKDRAARSLGRRGTPSPSVKTTEVIAASVIAGTERNHSIDNCLPIDGPDADLLVDPYFLGYWLGDGSSQTAAITTADEWVLEELARRGLVATKHRGLDAYGIRYDYPHNRKTESVSAHLRQLGLLARRGSNKHIPASYMRASARQRRELLAGLVDSDGHMQKGNGSCEITQKNQRLASQIIELLRSLGEKPRVRSKTATIDGRDCGLVYRVSWRPRVNPALMPRKAEVWRSPGRVLACGQRRITSVTEVESRPVKCATVANMSHLFLVGDGFIPTSNSVGKSQSIEVRMFAFPFLFPGQEAVITAPELIHLEPITQLVETRFEQVRLGREMKRKDATHRPFMLEFVNGARIIGRIPQKDGKGVKGVHPIWLEQDEASDYPEPGWKEIVETLKRGTEGSMWRAHGVTRGMRDTFYKVSQHGQDDPPLRTVSRIEDNKWTVHRIVAMARPNWTAEERLEKEQQYGSREDPDYRRNVLGSHGDAQNPLFVMHRLMRVVDDNPSSEYNTDDYYSFAIKDTELDRMQADITELIAMPEHHRKYKTTWMGADIGFTQDPTEILVFAEYPLTAKDEELKTAKALGKAVPQDGLSRLKCIARITLRRISEPAQADVIVHLVDFYKPKCFAMDSTGAGLPLFQQVQRRMMDVADVLKSRKAREAAESIKGFNFSSKIVVDFDETIEEDEDWSVGDRVNEAGITRNVLEYSTDVLRTYVDDGRLWLPWDTELIGEMGGQTFSYSKATMDRYGRRRIFSQGTFHALDAMRMAVLGHKQHAIDAYLNAKPADEPVFDQFMTEW